MAGRASVRPAIVAIPARSASRLVTAHQGLEATGDVTRQTTLPVPVALWLPNAAFFLAGMIFLA